MRNNVTDFITYSFLVAGILVLTANKNGANFVTSLSNGYTGIVQAVTGQQVTK